MVDILLTLLETLYQASMCSQNSSLPTPKTEIGSITSKDNLFGQNCKLTLYFKIDIVTFSPNFKATIIASFPSTSLNYTVINAFLQMLSALTIVKLTTSTRTNSMLQTSVDFSGPLTWCTTLTRIVGRTKALLMFLGTCTVRVKCGMLTFAFPRWLFIILAKVTITVLKARPYFKLAVIAWQNKQVLFSRCITKGYTFLRKRVNRLKMSLEIFNVQSNKNQKRVYSPADQNTGKNVYKDGRACCQEPSLPFMEQTSTMIFLGEMVHITLP